ncbi:MAG: transglutaminase-like domain-containing protein [Clostridiales bacterium]|nr:transglutaminase-like domain-containing protein [Clostridiales bacterium]
MRNIAAAAIAAFISLSLQTSAYAAATIDTSEVAKGLVKVQYSGELNKAVKVLVEANGDKNVYSVRDNEPNYVPLQMGTGLYKISMLQNVTGNKYKPLFSQEVKVDKIDQNAMFSSPSLLISFNSAMKSIVAYHSMTSGEKKSEAVNMIYKDLVLSYSYDFDKVKNLPTDYVPVIDEMYIQKKGICYDYSALLAGVLRSQGIPTKLIMGYAPNVKEYHAWNEILVDGKWIVVDTTYDSQLAKANMAFTFAKNGEARKVVKIY